MGGLRICRYRQAQRPYYIKKISTNIFTMEELCFFLYNNMALVDDSVMNEDLFTWLEEEIGLRRLAGILRQNVQGGASYRKLVTIVMEQTAYCTSAQLKNLINRMSEDENKPASQMMKAVGDRMLSNGRYEKAIREYSGVLRMRKRDNQTDDFVSAVYHNMGVAYGRLFHYTEAAQCFAMACRKNENPRSREQYLLAVKMGGTPVEFMNQSEKGTAEAEARLERMIAEVTEDPLVKQMRRLRELQQQGEQEAYGGAMKEVLDEWKKECARGVST